MKSNIYIPPSAEGLLQKTIPSIYKPYLVNSMQSAMVSFALGTIIINSYVAKGYSIFVVYYVIEKSGSVNLQSATPFVELLFPFHNDFISTGSAGDIHLKQNQFNLFYHPFLKNEMKVEAGKIYSLCSLQFTTWFLEPFAKYAVQVQNFLQQIEKQQPVVLLTSPYYLQPQMITLVNDLLQQNFISELSSSFFDLKVTELMFLVCNRLSNERNEMNMLSQADIQIAEEATAIIKKNLEQFHTISQLAHLLGTNENKLKASFKQLYGTSVFDYSRALRLEHARQLLIKTEWTVQRIALAVGYPEASNFSIAFKQQFGYTPGYLKKKQLQ